MIGLGTPVSSAEVAARAKRHTLFEWSAQRDVSPLSIARGEGVYVWTEDGQRYLDFNSQLMCVNLGHGDQRVIRAIVEQASRIAYVSPAVATEARACLGETLARICPGDIDVFFFTNGGSDANEIAIRIARHVTGRPKILARYRSYHGATAGSLTLTGDPRRWAVEPGMAGVVHVPHPYRGIKLGWEPTSDAVLRLEELIQLEGPQTIAAFILEPITGTNGVLVPPDGYLEAIREICSRYGILLICDEVMTGFGRTGEWFAIDNWRVVPDLLTMAKGLTSAYVPLGAVGMSRRIADHFDDHVFFGGLTFNSHPVSCAAALATIAAYEQDNLVARARTMGRELEALLAALKCAHRCVGDVRSRGLLGIVELVRSRDTLEPLAPFNGTSLEMAALGRLFREYGLYTMIRWNTFFIAPPLCITREQLSDGMSSIDRALTQIDGMVA